LHVLTVATTGSDLEHTPGSTGRLDQQQQQQQRHTGTDDEALAEEEGPESVAEVRVLWCMVNSFPSSRHVSS
jgi:hypothetical protein